MLQKSNEITRGTCDAELHVIPLQHPKIMNNNKFLRLSPPCVRTLQCNGCCKNREKCIPKNSVKQFFKTFLIDSSIQPIAQVVQAFVYKHENCQCQCELTAKVIISLFYLIILNYIYTHCSPLS